MLGTPFGHEDFVIAQLDELLDQHQVLLSRIPLITDVQSAWALLLYCARGRANYILRVIRPKMVVRFATGHNNGLWQCLCTILPPAVRADPSAQALATLPLSMGGCGLRDALRTNKPAFWASGADCLSMLRARHPAIVDVVSVAPSSTLTRIESHLLRVVLLRRLRLPLPLSVRQCRCGRSLDVFGHHRAACARAGVLGRRGFAVESAGARKCREASGRVVFNAMLRDFDLGAPNRLDSRRVEILADGLLLFGGAQLAVDTTSVSALHCDGSAHSLAANVDGRRRERTHPELVTPRARARLVVLAGEMGGRWSEETRRFLSLLAKAKARSEPHILRKRVEQAWRLRWGGILACAAARAFAASLLDLRLASGVDGDVSASHEVVNELRHAGLEA